MTSPQLRRANLPWMRDAVRCPGNSSRQNRGCWRSINGSVPAVLEFCGARLTHCWFFPCLTLPSGHGTHLDTQSHLTSNVSQSSLLWRSFSVTSFCNWDLWTAALRVCSKTSFVATAVRQCLYARRRMSPVSAAIATSLHHKKDHTQRVDSFIALNSAAAVDKIRHTNHNRGKHDKTLHSSFCYGEDDCMCSNRNSPVSSLSFCFTLLRCTSAQPGPSKAETTTKSSTLLDATTLTIGKCPATATNSKERAHRSGRRLTQFHGGVYCCTICSLDLSGTLSSWNVHGRTAHVCHRMIGHNELFDMEFHRFPRSLLRFLLLAGRSKDSYVLQRIIFESWAHAYTR